ncbi:MAG: DUF2461 domain-containing protein [Clostridiales bacterium]|nr:DUF2461 domain-containing protein [Clostridiales bacterium]
MEKQFNGFHPDGLGFLIGMAMQNDPSYYNANKHTYEDKLRKPLVDLITDLSPLMLKIDANLDTSSRRTLCRIRRDARFHPKFPYRTHMWFSFKPPNKGNSEYFTYHFYIDPDICSSGIGFYSGQARSMITAYKKRILEEPKLFKKIINIEGIKKLDLVGEEYKRKMNKIPLPNVIEKWYNKKSFSVHLDEPIDQLVFSHELLKKVQQRYIDLVPLYDFVTGRDVRFNFKF